MLSKTKTSLAVWSAIGLVLQPESTNFQKKQSTFQLCCSVLEIEISFLMKLLCKKKIITYSTKKNNFCL